MSEVDPNLVKAIAEQVMAALRQAGPSSSGTGGSGGGATRSADIRPPIGICTGDYSKFPELAHLASAIVSEQAGGLVNTAQNAIPTSAPTLPTPPALKGVITVAQIKKLRAGEVVRLAKGAMISPLAADFIKEKGLIVASEEHAPIKSVNAGPEAPKGTLPLLWWIDGQCPSVAKVIDSIRPRVLASRERSSTANLKAVVKELAAGIRNRKVSGGILFVSSASRAALYANRCNSIRAIVATTEKSVTEGIDQLGANVLIVEYPQFGARAMSAFVQPYLDSAKTQPIVVAKDLDELRMCG